jgi:hypothetical protein
MSTHLHIASRVEAAVEAYLSVREFSEREEWLEGFDRELVSASAYLHGVSITLTFHIESCRSGITSCF